ncbi:hypothetical protein [Paenibacillus catalpae]|nr:hypothetical protein [Paenibacillus catalpae]
MSQVRIDCEEIYLREYAIDDGDQRRASLSGARGHVRNIPAAPE